MAKTYTNIFNLEKDDSNEFYNVRVQSDNMEKTEGALIDNTKVFYAEGSGTEITINRPSLSNYFTGLRISFVAKADNEGASTTINLNGLGAKNLYKLGTTIAPKLVVGKAYDAWYDGSNFFLKASAEGTATADKVLAGHTFSNDDDTGIVGTMIDWGAVNIIPSTINQQIPKGYHNGEGVIKSILPKAPSRITSTEVPLSSNTFTVTHSNQATVLNNYPHSGQFRFGGNPTNTNVMLKFSTQLLDFSDSSGVAFQISSEGYGLKATLNTYWGSSPTTISKGIGGIVLNNDACSLVSFSFPNLSNGYIIFEVNPLDSGTGYWSLFNLTLLPKV